MRRALGAFMIAGLILGAAACGSSGGDDKASDKTETTAKPSGGGEIASGNADVKAYCKAVDEYVQKVKDAEGDASKMSALTADSQELAKKAGALATANLNADDAKAVGDCTKKSTDALLPG